jgi:hypothetical protein
MLFSSCFPTDLASRSRALTLYEAFPTNTLWLAASERPRSPKGVGLGIFHTRPDQTLRFNRCGIEPRRLLGMQLLSVELFASHRDVLVQLLQSCFQNQNTTHLVSFTLLALLKGLSGRYRGVTLDPTPQTAERAWSLNLASLRYLLTISLLQVCMPGGQLRCPWSDLLSLQPRSQGHRAISAIPSHGDPTLPFDLSPKPEGQEARS